MCVVIDGDLGRGGGADAGAADDRRGTNSLPLWMACILARFAFDWCLKELGGIGEKSFDGFSCFFEKCL